MTQFLVTFTLFIFNTIGQSNYYVNKILPWSEATTYCETECNSELVSIHSTAEFNNIKSLIMGMDRTSSLWIWIGLKYTDSSFKWTDQTLFNYSNWQSSQPSMNNNCVVMTRTSQNTTNYQWETKNCDDTNSNTFICNSCHHTIAHTAPSYHLNPNILDWNKGNSYCENHCNTHLASIHNERDNVYAKYLANNGRIITDGYSTNVSIGLFKQQSATDFQWKDNSVFDYGNNYKDGEFYVRPYPWTNKLSIDNNEKCVRMRSDENYEFQESNNDSAVSRFMCNSCDSILNKYVVMNTKMMYDDAVVYCRDELGTSLASIHSISDYNEAKLLCELTDNGDCYFGLSHLTYDDTTEFDFGNDQSMYPWSADITGGQVVLSQVDSYKWKAVEWDENHIFICNMPSQFCNSNWEQFGDNGWTKTNNCNVRYENNGASIMTNKQFVNKNGELLIELIYRIRYDSQGSAGIMLFNMQSTCDYYYISITRGIHNKLVLGKISNGIYNILNVNETMTNQLDIAYVLRIKVLNTNTFNIYINNNLMIEYTDISNTNNIMTVLSGYIGIMNRNLSSTFHSLHISGSEWIYDNIDLNICDNSIAKYNTIAPTTQPTINPTNIPTNVPTYIPTVFPTINPSIQPTIFPTYNPSKHPSFEPTNIPTIEPTFKPTVEPIDLESGSVDEGISTTILGTKSDNNKQIKEENGILFLHIIYIISGVVICCLMGICILIIYIRKNKLNANKNQEIAHKRLELEKTKPEAIKIRITKRQTTDSMEQMYGENDGCNDEINVTTAGETPMTGTSSGQTPIDGTMDLLNESDSDSDIENDYMNKMYEKPTISKITKGYSNEYVNNNRNEMINDKSESDDNMYNNKHVKETETSGQTPK